MTTEQVIILVLALAVMVLGGILVRSTLKNKQQAAENVPDLLQESREIQLINQEVIEISNIIRNSLESIQVLCNNLLADVASRFECGYGAISLLNPKQQQLELVAAYAYDKSKAAIPPIQPGSTVTGQAFLENNAVVIKDLPSNYASINSGLGFSQPLELLLVPLKFSNIRVGVLELASFGHFTKKQLQIMSQVSETLSASLITLQTNTEQQELIAELENKSEKLRSKERELEQNIIELEKVHQELETSKKVSDRRFQEHMESQKTLIEKTIQRHKKSEEALKQEIKRLREELKKSKK